MPFPMTLRLRLIDGWHHAWKFSSIRFLALGAACQTAVITTPPQIAAHIDEHVWQGLSYFSLACIVLAGAGRITTTEKPNEPRVP